MPPKPLDDLFREAGVSPDDIRTYTEQMIEIATAPAGTKPAPAFTISSEMRATIESVFDRYRQSQPIGVRDTKELVRNGQLPPAALDLEVEIWQDGR